MSTGDIETIQTIVRKLREAGGLCNSSCGIHIHIDAAPYDAKTLRNLVNVVASKEDLIFKALGVDPRREADYCQKVDGRFLKRLNDEKEDAADVWYMGYCERRSNHYHDSRYHALNLHAVFSHGTVEFRMFNSTLHAGKVKTYIQFALAVSAQALNQKNARPVPTRSSNEKYTFRTWLLRLGMIGDEFKTARKFLLENLDGNVAWRDPEQELRQKERLLCSESMRQHLTGTPPQRRPHFCVYLGRFRERSISPYA